MKDNRHVYEGKDGAIEDIITGKRYFLLVARRDPTDPTQFAEFAAALSRVSKVFGWLDADPELRGGTPR